MSYPRTGRFVSSVTKRLGTLSEQQEILQNFCSMLSLRYVPSARATLEETPRETAAGCASFEKLAPLLIGSVPRIMRGFKIRKSFEILVYSPESRPIASEPCFSSGVSASFPKCQLFRHSLGWKAFWRYPATGKAPGEKVERMLSI